MNYVNIDVYMVKTKDERRSHLVLNEPCVEIGGQSSQYRGILAHHLGTTIPKGMKIHLCHACNNSGCSNPRHLCWGTPKENQDDSGVRELGRAARKGKPSWNKDTKGLQSHSDATRAKMSKSRGSEIRNPLGVNQYTKNLEG